MDECKRSAPRCHAVSKTLTRIHQSNACAIWMILDLLSRKLFTLLSTHLLTDASRKRQKCIAADGKSADIQLAKCLQRVRLLFQSQTQMKSCLHQFCPCWQSEGRSQVGTRLGVMVSTKKRQLSSKTEHKHLQTSYLGYVNAFLLIGYMSPKGTFQQTAVYVCTDSSSLTFPARVLLHLRGWRDTHRSWSFVNSLFSLHTEKKKKKKHWLQKRLSSLLFLQQGRQARGPTCKNRQSRPAEWLWTLPPFLFDLQIRLIVSSKKLVWSDNQTSKPVHGRTAGQRQAAGLNTGGRLQEA